MPRQRAPRPPRKGLRGGQRKRDNDAFQSQEAAIPRVQALRLARELGEAEAAREVKPRPSLAIPRLGGLARRAALQDAWRWAGARVIGDRIRLKLIYADAAVSKRFGNVALARQRALHAHQRLGALYFLRGEHSLARDHLLKVKDLGQRGKDPKPLGAVFWRRLGACDLALHALEEEVGERPFERDEVAAAERVRKEAEARLRARRQKRALNRRRGSVVPGLPEGEAEAEMGPGARAAAAAAREADKLLASLAADGAIEAERAARRDLRLRDALESYKRSMAETPFTPATAGRAATVLLELGVAAERAGNLAEAMERYARIVDFFRFVPAYEDACLRAAALGWRLRARAEATRARALEATLNASAAPAAAPAAPEAVTGASARSAEWLERAVALLGDLITEDRDPEIIIAERRRDAVAARHARALARDERRRDVMARRIAWRQSLEPAQKYEELLERLGELPRAPAPAKAVLEAPAPAPRRPPGRGRGAYQGDDLVELLFARGLTALGAVERAQPLFERVFRRRRTNGMGEALEVDTCEAWLRARRTWMVLAEEAGARHERCIAIDFYEHGLSTTTFELAPDATEDDVAPDDDVGMLLALGRQLQLNREPAAAKRVADRAFALKEWDPRARRVAIAYDPAVHDRFEAEEEAHGVIRRGFRGRVWRRPFWRKLKANDVRLAEAAREESRFGHPWARETLARLWPRKWRFLLGFEDQCISTVQRFVRAMNRRKKFRLLEASRRLRELNTTYSAWARDKLNLEKRAKVLKVASAEPPPPADHRLAIAARRVLTEDRSILAKQCAWRRALAHRRYDDRQTEVWRQQEEREEAERRAEEERVRAEAAAKAQAALTRGCMLVQAWVRGDRARKLARRRRAHKMFRCALLVTTAVKRYARERRIMMRAAAAFDPRIQYARQMQRNFRAWKKVKIAKATKIQTRQRGIRDRKVARLALVRATAGDILKHAWAKRNNGLRGEVLLERLRTAAPGTPEPTEVALERLALKASEDAETAAAEKAHPLPPKKGPRPLWLSPGPPRSKGALAARRRRSLAARGLNDIDGPLFALQLEAWDCALKTLSVDGAVSNFGLLKAAGGCKSMEDVALVNCGCGAKAEALFGAMAATGLSAQRVLIDDDNAHRQRPRDQRDVVAGPAALCLGDYVFRRVGALRSLSLVRCGVADAGAAALGAALRGSPLAELRLDDNRIGSEGAAGLGAGLATAQLRVLGLRDNCVASPGLLALLEGLGKRAEKPASGHLDLRDNHTDCGAVWEVLSLLRAARGDPTARGLKLEGNAWLPKKLARVHALLEELKPAPLVVEAPRTPKRFGRTAPVRVAPSPRRFLQMAASKKRTPKRVPVLLWPETC